MRSAGWTAACLALLAAAYALLTARGADSGPPRAVAFVDVAVVAMETDSILRGRTVVVVEDRIVAVGPAASTPIPSGAHRIEGGGLYLMPGLADLHVHLFESRDLDLYLANGVTTIRNLGGYGAADSILAIRSAIRRGEREGPDIVTSGNWLDGDPPFRDVNTVVATPEEARRAVAEQAAAGYDFVKVYGNLSPAAYAAILEAAREAGIPVTGHVPAAVGLDAVLDGGQVAIDHVGQILVTTLGMDTVSARVLAARTAEAGVAVTTTLVMLERSLLLRGGPARVEALLARPEARYLSRRTREFWQRNPFASLPPAGDDRLQAAHRLAFALRQAGVPLLLGTDAGLWGNPPGFSVHDELGHLVAAGLTPYEALRAGTIDAAAFIAKHVPGTGEFGRITPGYRADLILLEANPLADVGNARRIAGVMARGRWYPREELDRRLEALARS